MNRPFRKSRYCSKSCWLTFSRSSSRSFSLFREFLYSLFMSILITFSLFRFDSKLGSPLIL